MPIINQPQVAILGVGDVEKRPVVIDDAIAHQADGLPVARLRPPASSTAPSPTSSCRTSSRRSRTGIPSDGLDASSTCARSRSAGSVASPYADALALQRALVEERRAGRIDDVLLLVEHPHVLTLGVRGDGGRSHILATADALAARGVEVHETGRGGDITYHGPGQIVGYPILDLQARSLRRAPLRARSRRSADSDGRRLRRRRADASTG